jgi:hypothetical protein
LGLFALAYLFRMNWNKTELQWYAWQPQGPRRNLDMPV